MRKNAAEKPKIHPVTILAINADKSVNIAFQGKVYYSVRTQRPMRIGQAKAIRAASGEFFLL